MHLGLGSNLWFYRKDYNRVLCKFRAGLKMVATTLTGQRYSRMLVPAAFSHNKSFFSSLPDLANEKKSQES